LDLHGLHSKEALQALQQRLDLLQELLLDVMNVRSSGNASSSSIIDPGLSGFGSGQQLLEFQRLSRLPVLRVIVGKGNHSTGGEATLPRAVEHYLIDAQYKHVLRGGAIEVKLKRLCANRP
jgi:DNA-nicking Smr family endonuclease